MMNMITFFLANLNAQAQGASSGGGILQMLMPFALIFAVFYFLLIRPEQKKRKTHQSFINELKRGDEVYTTSGIIGTITNVADKFVTLEISEGVKVKMVKGMVSGSARQVVQETENKG